MQTFLTDLGHGFDLNDSDVGVLLFLDARHTEACRSIPVPYPFNNMKPVVTDVA